MKKGFSLFLVLVLLTGLLCALSVPAAAASADDGTIRLVTDEGQEVNWTLNEAYGVRSVLDHKGSLPDGLLTYVQSDGQLILHGTASKAGEYQFQLFVEYYDAEKTWNDQIGVVVTVKPRQPAVLPPVITKHPTGETVTEGGYAEFIASAKDATQLTWRIVSKDTTLTVYAANAPAYFPGVRVSGLGNSCLVLENIPAEMNGWSVEAKFDGPGGTVYSNGAVITVLKNELKLPVINAVPQGAELQEGGYAVLSVSAVSPDNNTLSYQWYKSAQDSNTNGAPIAGAVGSAYTVSYEVGTAYYYCAVRNNRGGEVSAAVTTAPVAVTGIPAATPTPVPTPEPTAAPTEMPATDSPAATEAPAAPAETAAPTAAPAAPQAPEKADHTVTIVIAAVACVALVCLTMILRAAIGKSRRK